MNLPRAALILFLSAILWLVLSQFFFSTRYIFFDSPVPFKGAIIYNPYDSLYAEKWVKSNFHAHSIAWKGITNGQGTAQDIHHAYDSLQYGIHCVSNYQTIDTTYSSEKNYISAYEHGYNLLKVHQLVLGIDKVYWPDYLLPQTLNNKQDVLNYLSSDTNAVVILNHPAVRNGYTTEDLLYLTNYDCMEVLNPAAISLQQWDAALSAGKPVYIVGNDDIHDILKKDRLGRMCTFVNVPVQNKKNVLKALKRGMSYGMILGARQDPYALPSLESLKVIGDTVVLQVNKEAKKITFTGQNGRLLAIFPQTETARYVLKKDDHYARATIEYENGTSMFLNPVFFTHSPVLSKDAASVNHLETTIFRLIGLFIAIIWIKWVGRFITGRKKSAGGNFLPPSFPGRLFRGILKRKKSRIALDLNKTMPHRHHNR
ncbi:MAG: CehA/McbA family metallohydrolase domain-containing protein [Daejeonella sp.]